MIDFRQTQTQEPGSWRDGSAVKSTCLGRGPGSAPSTHIMLRMTAYHSSPKGSNTLSAFLSTCTYTVRIPRNRYTCRLFLKINSRKRANSCPCTQATGGEKYPSILPTCEPYTPHKWPPWQDMPTRAIMARVPWPFLFPRLSLLLS